MGERNGKKEQNHRRYQAFPTAVMGAAQSFLDYRSRGQHGESNRYEQDCSIVEPGCASSEIADMQHDGNGAHDIPADPDEAMARLQRDV